MSAIIQWSIRCAIAIDPLYYSGSSGVVFYGRYKKLSQHSVPTVKFHGGESLYYSSQTAAKTPVLAVGTEGLVSIPYLPVKSRRRGRPRPRWRTRSPCGVPQHAPLRRRRGGRPPGRLPTRYHHTVKFGKSRRRRAYPQQIVTTRLLYCLQDPFAQLSRLQRI